MTHPKLSSKPRDLQVVVSFQGTHRQQLRQVEDVLGQRRALRDEEAQGDERGQRRRQLCCLGGHPAIQRREVHRRLQPQRAAHQPRRVQPRGAAQGLRGAAKHASFKVRCGRQLGEFDALPWTRSAEDEAPTNIRSWAPNSENRVRRSLTESRFQHQRAPLSRGRGHRHRRRSQRTRAGG